MTTLWVEKLSHTYSTPGLAQHPVLHNIQHWEIAPGEQLLLRGISGSGKTTLLNIIAGLLHPTQGAVYVAGQSLYTLSEAARDQLRRQTIGYIFQSHYLLPMLNALENVMMPLAFAGVSATRRRQRAQELLEAVELAPFADHRPAQLSAGQRQRVGIARALANRPQLVLADEPTAALDVEAREQIMTLLQTSCQSNNASLLVSSHDPALATRFGRIFDLQAGRLVAVSNG